MTVTGPRLTQRPDEEVRGIVTRLMAEEDILRRDQMEMTSNLGDKVNTGHQPFWGFWYNPKQNPSNFKT